MSRSCRPKKARHVNANPLFCQWLKEWKDEASKKGCQSRTVFAKALHSLNKFPLQLKSGNECNILKNFGKKICDMLDKKLTEHRRLHPDFDENTIVTSKGNPKPNAWQTAKPVLPVRSAQQGPGPSEPRGRPPTNGGGVSLPAKSNPKSSKLASLKVRKANRQIPDPKANLQKNSAICSERTLTTVRQETPIATVAIVDFHPSINDPDIRSECAKRDCPPAETPQGEIEPDVIDLCQDQDEENDSILIPLGERLSPVRNLGAARRETEERERDAEQRQSVPHDTQNCDDDEDDCIIVSENFGDHCTQILNDVSKKTAEPKAETDTRSTKRRILEDYSFDPVDVGEPTDGFEDSSNHLDPSPVKNPSVDNSILDISAQIRKKRESFLNKFNTQPTRTCEIQKSIPQLSFSSSPDATAAQEEVLPSAQQTCEQRFLDSSKDELLIPLSRRIELKKRELCQNDSFSELIQNIETPPLIRVTERVVTTELEPVGKPIRKRKKATTTAADGDATPVKKPRTKKKEEQHLQEAPVNAFNLRYVPEGTRPPCATNTNAYAEHSPSKCPRKVILKPGTFDIILCVDSCEAVGGVSAKRKETLIKALSSSGVKMEVRKMNVGDFAWIAKYGDDELVLDCVVERKRTDDLAASIKDGRYAEQKHRLITSGIKQKIYLIEEYSRFVTGGISDQALLQAHVNTQVINDFIVKQTKNTKESAQYLITLTRALELKYRNLRLRSCLKEEAQAYENHLMTWQEYNESGYKRKKVCSREMFIRGLMVVRGMSLERALTVVTVYPTVTALLEAFQNCEQDKHKDDLLANLRCPVSGRRIGPALSKAVKRIFIEGVSGEQQS